MAKILITGGGGFIAPHLLNRLDPDCDITLHVRDSAKCKFINFHPKVSIISGALGASEILKKIPEGCDAVIHLAGAVHGSSVDAILESNVVTTSNVISIMAECGIPKIIFLSTASVWSEEHGQILNEQTPANPSTLYGYAKLSAECLIRDALNNGRINTAVVLRANNTYGDGATQGVVANFKSAILKNNPIQINGDGNQLRQPLHVSDLVEAILKTMTISQGLHTYCMAGPETLTIHQMAEIIAGSLKHELIVDWQADHPERARHLVLSIEKAKQDLGWEPHVRLGDGVTITAEAKE